MVIFKNLTTCWLQFTMHGKIACFIALKEVILQFTHFPAHAGQYISPDPQVLNTHIFNDRAF